MKRTITRRQLHNIFDTDFCCLCGKTQPMSSVGQDLPGIFSKRCDICNSGMNANNLESDSDLIDVPENYILPEGI